MDRLKRMKAHSVNCWYGWYIFRWHKLLYLSICVTFMMPLCLVRMFFKKKHSARVCVVWSHLVCKAYSTFTIIESNVCSWFLFLFPFCAGIKTSGIWCYMNDFQLCPLFHHPLPLALSLSVSRSPLLNFRCVFSSIPWKYQKKEQVLRPYLWHIREYSMWYIAFFQQYRTVSYQWNGRCQWTFSISESFGKQQSSKENRHAERKIEESHKETGKKQKFHSK